MKLNCLLVDDEPLALELIERYVNNTPFLSCKGKCSSAFEALNVLENEHIDLLFLDIQMPELSGLALSRMISKETRIIFTTAFDQYALEGYKVNALDYLVKPFSYQEFFDAAVRARNWFEAQHASVLPVHKPFIFVKSEYKQVKINLDEVIYFEGLKDYIKIWLRQQPRPVLTLLSLKSLESELDPGLFMRVHRSFIVSLNDIRSVDRSRLLMSNGILVNIADQYKTRLQEYVAAKLVN